MADFLNKFFQYLFRIPTHKDYRSDIDGLRAIAILLVVSYHTVPHRFKGGFIGVDIFFVISGYLISRIIFKSLKSETFSFKDFYLKRIKRIFPALIVLFTFILLYGYLYLLAADLKTLSKHVIFGILFVSNIVYWSEASYFDSGIKYLLHLWSLGIEEQFYILWPVILFFIHKYKRHPLVTFFVLWIVSFSINILLTEKNSISAFFLPHGRFWELMTGSFLGYVAVFNNNYLNYKFNNLFHNVQSLIGIFLIGAAFYWIDQDKSFPGWWALMPTLGTFLLISAGNKTLINKYLLSNRSLVVIGLISYPLYLWHWPLLKIASLMDYENFSQAKLFLILAVIISFVLSFLTYRFIEVPIRNQKSKEVNVLIVRSLTLLMLSFLSLSVIIYYKNGFIDNYPKIVFELDKYKNYETKEFFRTGKCLLEDQESPIFSKDCLDGEGRELLFIWGDSYAAHLVHGLNNLKAQKKFRVAQYSSAACPPILNFESNRHSFCKSINQFIGKNLVLKLNPSVIVLSAYWPAYFFPQEANFKKDMIQLKESISSLKHSGISNIVLFGPLPEWESGGLPDLLIRRIVFKKKMDIPLRIRPKKINNVIELDEKFRELATELEITYLSPLKFLCDAEGCLTRTDEGIESLISFDHGHLTRSGSEFLVKLIFPELSRFFRTYVE
ncbi:acyltransferase family protein [Leptospira kirschneri]|uniref:acyltransferase family protein n=3 Tax=Leptospira kirschneri TaxID=29507 RepID=UPI00099122EF|nr:acyltransferase family protein [Leptospira kirschneri]